MRKPIILIICIFLCQVSLLGKDTTDYQKWYWKLEGGFNIPLQGIKTGQVTDNLIEYNDVSYNWQLISANYFFHRNWGVDLSIQSSYTLTGRSERFDNFLKNQKDVFSEKYFIKPEIEPGYHIDGYTPAILGNSGKILLGLVYRNENQYLLFMADLLLGFTVYNTDRAYFSLKEKGANNYYYVRFIKRDENNDFTIAPTIKVGYKFSQSIILNIDLMYSYFRTNFVFLKESDNPELLDGMNYEYKVDAQILTLGIGCIIAI